MKVWIVFQYESQINPKVVVGVRSTKVKAQKLAKKSYYRCIKSFEIDKETK